MDDRWATRLIHGGEGERSASPVTTPIYETTTFTFDSAEQVRARQEGRGDRFLYSRYANPTVVAVEETLAAVDGAEAALVFGSGMAAVSTVLLALLRQGDEIVCGAAVYGGTAGALRTLLPRLGIGVRFLSLAELAAPAEVIGPRTRVVWFESPTNPSLRCVDIGRVAEACRARGVLSVIDNTFAGPLNQRVLDLGVDLSVQSASKYLGGHSDITAGVVTGRAELIATIDPVRRVLGGVLDPQPAYLLGRSLKTLDVRTARHNANAMAVATAIEGHPALARVDYPGLPSHPDHGIAREQMLGFGGMVCIDVVGGEPAACRAFDRLQIFARAASLGGVESLCSLPVLTSHWGQDDAQLAAADVTRGMMRLSIGLESPEDLIADLRQALA